MSEGSSERISVLSVFVGKILFVTDIWSGTNVPEGTSERTSVPSVSVGKVLFLADMGNILFLADVGRGADVVLNGSSEQISVASVGVCGDIILEHAVVIARGSTIASAGVTDHMVRTAGIAEIVPLHVQV